MKTIKINKKLENRIYDFCDDELNYHIHDSGCPEEYHNETMGEIELLHLLEYDEQAKEYLDDYICELKDILMYANLKGNDLRYIRNNLKEAKKMKEEI